MPSRNHNIFLAIAAVIGLLGIGAGTARAAEDDRASESIMVVNADHVYVRSGAGDSYYPFGKLDRGDVIRVVGEKYSWARVETIGPAFDGFFGYVRLPQNDRTALVDVPDSRNVLTTAPVDLLAPNLNTEYSPDESWKRILQIPEAVELTVLETMESDRSFIYRVELPAKATGFISLALLAPATPVQIEAWRLTLTPAAERALLAEEVAAEREAAREVMHEMGTAMDDAVIAEPTVRAPVVPVVTMNETPDPLEGREVTIVVDPVVAEDFVDPALVEVIIDPEPFVETAPDMIGAESTPALPKMETSIDLEPARETRDKTPLGLLHRLEQLETSYRLLRQESIQYAEVLPLRALYFELARDAADEPDIHRPAKARSEQLAIWADLQSRRNEIAALRQRVNLSAEAAASAWDLAELRGGYDAIGRLERSIVFHGGGDLPVFYRVQDPRTGRTIVYVRPTADLDLPGMVGQRVGVIGAPLRNPSLGVLIITPRRIDLLASTG